MRNIHLSSSGKSISSPSVRTALIGIAARSSLENAKIGAETSKVTPSTFKGISKPTMPFWEYIQKLSSDRALILPEPGSNSVPFLLMNATVLLDSNFNTCMASSDEIMMPPFPDWVWPFCGRMVEKAKLAKQQLR